ncbi:bacillithiol system redox-active protein YtxJ [Cyclobacterium jeungdonense]|uniref:Bacillithiol system redox-active protein YtxJ n=1 Tax=Cyclobacterium jeungdonense TaxID=708087 RepID=A0ABT8C7E4_9BACT|nr:bacillithiol system redox-active protein YtxJ [Cyclobacterium jeungdonense]MDN3687645.1 bacillithiol system redox-active protein YtxJ [Cyclobacterium jeungdonense]
MSWKKLEKLSQIEQIKEESKERPVVIFKHSSRCSISSMAWNRMERSWQEADSQRLSPYFLDLIAHRDVSNAIEKEFAVAHASPQVIVIRDGKAIYDNSHMGINYRDIASVAV